MQSEQPALEKVWRRARLWVAFGGVLAISLLMTYWGGTARPGPLFVAGVLASLGLFAAFGGLVWWLYFSRMAGPPPAPDPSLNGARQMIAVLAAIAGLMLITGTFWDEVWHRLYGVGTVIDDFFWRPHLMMYGSMGLNGLIMLGGLFIALRSRGGLRQRFRSEPLIGMVGLASLLMLAEAPTDVLWHRIYGLDITAWSLPHVLLFMISFSLVMLSAATLQVSVLPRRGWASLGGFRRGELIVLGLLAIAMVATMQIGVVEWEDPLQLPPGPGLANDAYRIAFWSRPEWLYPVILIMIATFFGSLILHMLKRPGAATALGLTVLGFRVVASSLIAWSSTPTDLPFVSQWLVLPPLVALDVWAALRRDDSRATVALGSLWAAAASLIGSAWLIPQTLAYPRINLDTLPAMIVLGVLLGLWSGWVGARAGRWMATRFDRPAAESRELIDARVAWAGTGVLAAFGLFAAFFILSATPPL